ncbi:MAG TPA: HAMP domain-containing protein [Ktedonobacterales bacterium]
MPERTRLRGLDRMNTRETAIAAEAARLRHVRRSQQATRRGNLALDLPIAWRLTLGFALAGAVAALAVGIIGVQRSAALSQQSVFYQNLLQVNTNLSTAGSFLQLMDTKTHEILDIAASTTPSIETLSADEADAPRLATYYDHFLSDYASHEMLSQQPDKLAILNLVGDTTASARQVALLSSAQRTWRAYQAAQTSVLASVKGGDVAGGASAERLAGEPTNADAQSALRTLLQFNGSLADEVRQAATVEEQNLAIASIVAALVAFAAVGLIGWLVSQTIVQRLGLLRAVTQAVGEGRIDARAPVKGRDEIGDVTESVNGMLDTIVGLLDETRRQRDALTGAAERLFTDMRVASGGDLRVTARVSSDPIGLLGNAFNLTIGRFKRLISRTHVSTNQIATLARHHIDRADAFLDAVRSLAPAGSRASQPFTDSRPYQSNGDVSAWSGPLGRALDGEEPQEPREPVERLGALISRLASNDASARAQEALDAAQQAYLSGGRLTQLTQQVARTEPGVAPAQVADVMMDELRRLEGFLQRLGRDVYVMRKTSDTVVEEMRETLTQITIAPRVSAASPATAAVASDGQIFEFIHLASSFAQETTALARQSLVVAEEMRVSVSPFKYDAPLREAMAAAGVSGPQTWGGDTSGW